LQYDAFTHRIKAGPELNCRPSPISIAGLALSRLQSYSRAPIWLKRSP
jgi:hypothetical protein